MSRDERAARLRGVGWFVWSASCVCVIKSPLPPAPPAGCIFAALSLAITQARCTLSLRGGGCDGDSPTRIHTHGAIPRRVFSLSIFPSARPLLRSPRSKCLRLGMYEAKLHRGPAGRADQKKDALVKIWNAYVPAEWAREGEMDGETAEMRLKTWGASAAAAFYIHNIPILTNLGL